MYASEIDEPAAARVRPQLGLRNLVLLEMRKAVNTRSGLALMAIVGILTALILIIGILSSQGDRIDLAQLAGSSMLPALAIVPVLGVLMASSEWSQRTGLTTFVLTPNRSRIYAAKLIAAWGVALGVVISAFVVGILLGTIAGRAMGLAVDTTGSWGALRLIGVSVLAGVLLGVSVGAATLSTPAALVIVLVVPVGFDTLLALVAPGISDFVSSSAFTNWVSGIGEFGPPAVFSLVVWVMGPAALGLWRYRTAEVQ